MTAGSEAGFGRSGLVPVTLILPSGPLQALHESLVRIAADLPGRITTPAYTLAGYRPHVSHRGERRVVKAKAWSWTGSRWWIWHPTAGMRPGGSSSSGPSRRGEAQA